jgi:choline dehydrogenase-like flavoprotein
LIVFAAQQLTQVQSETFHSKDWHKAELSVHGTSGPLHTEPHDLAPISECIKESMIDYGLPYHPDMFSTGETSHGCGDVPRTVHQGIRTTAADFITKTYRRDNITIKTEVTVDKIIMSRDSGELSVTGVATISKAGKKIVYQASKEIIVTAGAYCSPPILMRSGLGPKEQLEKHDIECLVDLPGVGSNLQDHVVCLSLFSVLLYSKYMLIPTLARLRLLRSYQTKPHKRLPCLPRQCYRLHLRPLSRKENRAPIYVPFRDIRIRPP